MLASLLPGIREIRTALVVGYIWMLAVWLAFIGRAPAEEESSGLWDLFYDLRSAVSALGIAVALSFLAWIVGLIGIALHVQRIRLRQRFYGWLARQVVGEKKPSPEELREGIKPKALDAPPEAVHASFRLWQRSAPMDENLVGWWLSRPAQEALVEYSRRRIAELAAEDLDAHDVLAAVARSTFRKLHPDVDRSAMKQFLDFELARLIFIERALVVARLLGNNDELHDEIDRVQHEADLRSYIFYPSVVLVLVLSVRVTFWLLPLLLVPNLIAFSARELRRKRMDLIVDAIVRGEVDPPIVGRMREYSEEAGRGRAA